MVRVSLWSNMKTFSGRFNNVHWCYNNFLIDGKWCVNINSIWWKLIYEVNLCGQPAWRISSLKCELSIPEASRCIVTITEYSHLTVFRPGFLKTSGIRSWHTLTSNQLKLFQLTCYSCLLTHPAHRGAIAFICPPDECKSNNSVFEHHQPLRKISCSSAF